MHRIDPHRDCPLCPRLAAFRTTWRGNEPDWHNAPVPTLADPRGDQHVRLLIVGLAPGLRGANRTGRPFTGDHAGDLLYATLAQAGFAAGRYGGDPADSLALRQCAITNAVRCVPPQNKPVGAEINACRPWLEKTLARFANLQAVLTLGRIGHESTLRALGVRMAQVPFSHGGKHRIARLTVFSSYHCSRYNTNTNRLTAQMFQTVLAGIRRFVDGKDCD